MGGEALRYNPENEAAKPDLRVLPGGGEDLHILHEKPKLTVISGGGEAKPPQQDETRDPNLDDWVWKNRINDVKEGRIKVSTAQTTEEQIAELRQTIANNKENREYNQAIKTAHARENLLEKFSNTQWNEKIEAAHVREATNERIKNTQEVVVPDFMENIKSRIDRLSGFLSPSEMAGLRSSFAELQRTDKLIPAESKEQTDESNPFEISDESDTQERVRKSHNEELYHAQDLLEYIEDREKEMARKQQTESLPNLSTPVLTPPEKPKGFFSKIKSFFGGK